MSSEERVVSDLVWTPERGSETPEVRGISWENFLLSDDKYLGKWKTDSGIRITPETALQSTIVLACCRILAETVSGLPLHVYRRSPDGGDEIAKEIPLYKVLTFRPNEWQTKQEFFEQIVMTLALWGNSYTRIRSGQYGSVSQLDNLHPSRMEVERLENGRLRYSYTDPETGRLERYTQDQIMHCRWTPEQDGIKGMVPVEIAREAIGLARACEQHAARFWANSARPGVVLQTEGTLNAEAAERLRDNWERLHRGSERAFRTAVLTGGMKAVELGMTNESSQFVASRDFQTAEICRVYRIPQHLIQGTPGGDLEVQGQEFVTYTLMPWLNRIESSISRSLIYNDDEFYAKFDVRGLLRANSQQRASYYSTMTSLGIMTINDCRRAEGLKPLGPIGDHHFVAMNMQTLEDATKPKPEAPAGGMPGGGGGDGPPPPTPGGPPSLPEVKTGKAPIESPKGEASKPKEEPQPQMEEAIEEASAELEDAVEDRAFCSTGPGGGIDNSCGGKVMAGPDKDSGGGSGVVSIPARDPRLVNYKPFVSVGDTKNSDFAKIPNEEEVKSALNVTQQQKFGAHRDLEPGYPIDLRIDINAFKRHNIYAVTAHEHEEGTGVGKAIGYDTHIRLKGPVEFLSNENSATAIGMGKNKGTHSTVKGAFDPDRSIPEDIDSWTPVGYDPHKTVYYYDKKTGEEIISGTDAVSVGNTVFTKNPRYGNAKEPGEPPRNAHRDYRSIHGDSESRAFCATGEGGGIDNSCGGGTAAVVREVLKSIEKTGGFSVHPVSAKSPKTGFMCATVPHAEKIFQSSEEITEPAIQSYLDQHKDFLSENPKLHLGGWIDPDTEKVYLDLSEQFEDEASAVAAGIKYNQLAVWDVANKREVRIRRDDNGQRSQAADSVRLSSGGGSEGDCGSVEQSTRGVEGAEESRDCDTGIEPEVDSRAFCPTGEGQGVDNSCGSGSGTASSSVDNSWKKSSGDYSYTPGEGKSPLVGGEDIKSLSISDASDVASAMKDLKIKSLTDVVKIGGGLTRGASTSVVANGEEIHVMSEVPIEPDNEESGSMSSTISLGVDPEGKKYIDYGTMHASTDEGTANLTGEDAARMSSILLEKFPESLTAAEKSGFDYAQTFAMGSSEDEFKGYRLWPQFGFDAEIYSDIRENIPKDVVPHDDPVTVQELISTPAGKKWWNANGESMAMTLSFKDKKSAGYKRFKDAIKLAERLKKRNEGRSLYDYLMGEERGFCATGPGGGIDNSCGVNMAPDRDMGSSVAALSAGAGKPASVTVESQGNLDKAAASLGLSGVDDVVTLGGGNVRGAKVDIYGDESGFVKVSSIWPIDKEDPRGGGKVFTEVSMANTPEGKVLGFEAFGPSEGSVATGASQQKVMSIISEKVAESIDAAEKHGFVAVTTFAVGDANNEYKGYRLWPQFGFDADLPRDLSKRVPPEIVLKSKGIEIPPAGSTSIPQHLVIKSLASQHRDLTIQELLKTREGDRWWDENGDDIELKLDLTDKSSLGYQRWEKMKDRLPRLRERNQTREFFDAFVEERAFCPNGEGNGVTNDCSSNDGQSAVQSGGEALAKARNVDVMIDGGKTTAVIDDEARTRALEDMASHPMPDGLSAGSTADLWDRTFVERNGSTKTKITSTDPVFPQDRLAMNGTYVAHESVGQYLSMRHEEARAAAGGVGPGAIIDTTQVLPQSQFTYVSDAMSDDVMHAYESGRFDPGFYSKDLEDAMTKMASRHPELATDDNNRFVFTMLTAILSNGQDPTANIADSDGVYEMYKEHGTCMPEGSIAGTRSAAAKTSLALFQSMLDSFGVERTKNLLSGYTTAENVNKTFAKLSDKSSNSEWRERTDSKPWMTDHYKAKDKKTGEALATTNLVKTDSSGEFKDEVVPMASIFGPKIGSFFANLNGRHDFLTMDRWLMRSVGRVTGELITRSTPQGAKSRAEDAIKALDVEKWKPSIYMFGVDKQFGVTKQDLLRSLKIQKKTGVIEENGAAYLWAIAAERSHKNTTKPNGGGYGKDPDADKHACHVAGNGLFKSLIHEQQDPRGAQARRSIREVFRSVVKDIEAKYPDRKGKVDVDEVQAILWQYEKNLWKHLGAKVQIDENSLYSKAADDLLTGKTKERKFKPESRAALLEALRDIGDSNDDWQFQAEQESWDSDIGESGIDFNELFLELERLVSQDEDRSAIESAKDVVVELRSAGLTKIVMQAAGREGLHVMGFDADIPKDIAETLPETLSHCKTLLDLHVSSEGRSWWEQNGREIDVAIDLEGVQGQIFDGFATGKTFSDIIEEGILDDYGNS